MNRYPRKLRTRFPGPSQAGSSEGLQATLARQASHHVDLTDDRVRLLTALFIARVQQGVFEDPLRRHPQVFPEAAPAYPFMDNGGNRRSLP